ncbi:MFS transporter [Subtercola frigoramans]|uniref:MFS family permease n=1 Tax=Subtercola frigoramans TaxID=120298 RepID=A0ABS2L2A1_9MICO|nr:MFS transporter [Subtercola frigoramans]MBM7471209.1 MFS family permease [Subtercola frigoramans]
MTTADPGLEPVAIPAVEGLPKDNRTIFSALLVLSQFFVLFSVLTPVVVALSIKLTTIVPPEEVAGVQGLVGGLTALCSIVATPIVGNLSDRTRSRFGRRRPWLIGGVLLGTAALLLVGMAETVLFVLVGSILAGVGFNATAAAIGGLYADRVPTKWHGRVGALIGVATNFAAIAGAAIATALAPNIVLIFVIPGVLAIIVVSILAAVIKDSKDDVQGVDRFSVSQMFKSFTWPVRQSHDFTVNLVSRFLIWMGYTAIIAFQALLFIQHFGIAPANVAVYLLAATGLSGIATLIGSVGGGWITDKTDKRRGFVMFSGLLMGAALVLYAFAPTVEFAIGAGVFIGLGLGIYLAVDLALATRLIPDARFTGRYMGIVQLASNLPQSIMPFLAPLLLAVGAAQAGPNFLLLFVVAGVLSILGAFVMLLMRTTR